MKLADLKELNAEQKKKLGLAGILGVLVVYGVMTLLVSPYINASSKDALDLAALTHDLDRAQQKLTNEAQIREHLEEADKHIKDVSRQSIPPLDNPLSWVAGKVYNGARQVGVEIESVSDLGITAAPWSARKETKRAFVPYTVRIVTDCGYAQLLALIGVLESENAYLCVSDISVTAQDGAPDKHKTSFSVQWPYWMNAEKAVQAKASGGTNNG